MSTFTLLPNNHLAVPYSVPWSGHIRYEAESEYPVTVMVMDPANLAAFRAGRPFVHYGQGVTASHVPYRQEATLPFRGNWYLVLANYQRVPAAVHFNVWS